MGDLKEKEEASDGVEDMIKLSDLSEKSLLTNLQVRYDKHQIYTYIGSILVAVNPYRMFNIYGLDMVKKYDGQPLGALPPHLFAIGSTSFNKMVKDNENQVVVISGESGAGKTESTKLLMQYLAAVNKSGNNLITEQILEANPLLESFGNAQTIRNDNSSRFGKYIEVFFKGGSIVGAKISEYLLEKSRIVTQASNERNYHVFYEILNGLSKQEKADYGLTTSDKYFYLNQGGNCEIDTRDDTENYSDLIAAMDVLNFSRFEQDTIKKLLASVLHMGNVYFDKIQGPDNHEVVELGTDAEVKWVSHLLGLATDWLTQALTSKVTEARGERLFTPYNIEQALDARDAIAKALYSRLFSWLVERVNSIISKSEKDKSTSLAVLDIFGFEDFYKNSFEQLCINYANETLQFFFNQHIFKQEQKEYSKEGIDWSYIVFKDNQPVIDIISAKPSGILHILDDECNFPQSTDHSFLEKCHFNHGDSDLYEKPRMSDPQFSIFHYAGKIKYNVISFLEKNKDTLRSGVIELLCESKNQMITQMFNDMRDRHITKTVSKSTGKFVTLKPRTPTVAANFHESLLSLIDTMSRCNPYFVRCIKPNDAKAPMLFDGEVVLDQLRYTGMLETIRIRKMGYTIRIRFTTFIDRYRCILRGQKILTGSTLRDICSMILKTMGEPYTEQYQLGSTKVFMKEPFEQHLDRTALKIQKDAVIRIQKVVRMFLARKRFQDMYSASARIQAVIRTFLTRKRYRVIQSGVIKAQAQYRMQRQRLKYIRAREQFRSRLDQERLLQQQRLEREKMEKEQRERAAKTLSNLANMEITAELAFVYSKLEEWNPPHHDRHLYTMTGEVTPIDMKYRLPSDVNSFPFSKYTSVYFRDADWGMRIEPLKTTLTSVSGDDNVKHALTVFKLILRFMHDHNMTERKEKLLSDYIVQQGLKNDAIRDEIYCQIVNQIWKNEKSAVAERGWILLANCLSCFSPSHTLFKYLLKFVSDHGHNGFKAFCQHKVLQCANIGPELCRVYPPSLLEWKAALLKYGMALDVQFADGKSMYGHVESWTSGELFTSHLLNLRGLQENNSGWTVCLQEDKDYYELLGYDYVLDLISEMEIPPNFPHGKSYFIVSSKHGRDSSVIRRSTAYSHSPHHPDTDRTMFIRGDLPEPLTIDTTAVMRGVRRSPKADELQFSMTSKLNQRPTEIQVDGLSHNRLNARYNKRLAPTPPLSNGNILNGNVLSTTLATDVRQDTDLARTKLNKRYHNGATDLSPTQNGEPLSNHMLNNRYMKSNVKTKSKAGASEQILRQKRTDRFEKAANMSEDSAVTPHSDWSHWVEDVFNNALHEHDAQSEPRSLEQRIKGGGKGVPGVQSQQTVLPGAGLLNNYATAPLTSPLLLPNVGGGSNELLQQQLMLLQAAQQQQAQQQAAQQAAAQQAAQQQALLQLQQQQKAQQQTALQSALHQQQLENRLLQESIQQQVLRNQLQQLQNNSVSPDSSFNSGLNQPSFQTTTQTNTVMNGMAPKAGLPNSISLATNETGKKVYKIESSLANKRIHNAPPVVGNKPQVNGDVMASTIKHYQFPPPGPEKNITVSSPPPPPPKTFVDISAQRQLHSPPPPPPPPVNYIQEESVGTFSFGDEEGRAKTVKVGKVVWPPPVMGQKKKELDVGRLDIDENMRQSLEDKVSPKKKWTKPEPPPETDKGPKSILKTKDQEVKKTKSLSETMHMATLKLLEQKLGGVSTATETEPLPEPKPSTSTTIETETDFRPPSPPSRPPPKKPLVTEETQTTATLHKSQKIGIDFTDSPKENIYSTKIVGPDTGIYETHIKRDREPSGKYNTEIKHAPPPDVVYEQQIKPSVDYAALEKVATQLFAQNKEQFLTYRNVPWTINVRKEVFSPCERLENQLALHLIFCQIVQDVYDSGCIRINKELRVKMRGMLESYGVNDDNYLTKNFKPQIKKIIIDTAKEWPVYFSRLFPVASSGHYSNIKYVGVSHSGIRLVTREKSLVDDYLDVHEYFRFEDVIDVVLPTRTTLQLNLKTKSIVFFTNRARQLKELIDVYCVESEKGNRYVIALKDYITKDATLLSFRRGDVIKLLEDDISTDRSGWLYGTTEGRIGWFPDNIIKVLARHEVDSAMVLKAEFLPKPKPKVRVVELPPLSPKPKPVVVPVQRPPTPPPPSPPPQPVVITRYQTVEPPRVQERVIIRQEISPVDDRSEASQGTIIHDGKYSMMEFAMLNFRESLENPGLAKRYRGSSEWTWKEQADMIKWTRSPIPASLLRLPSSELNKLAIECFVAIMQFMGDYPLPPEKYDFDCVIQILRNCHKYPELRDEVYCQLCKQTTSNKSMKPKSCVKGWRLFSIVASYCDCSETLHPYLFKYLEDNAADTSRSFNGPSAVCLQNLRKTFRYGGRKNVPLKEEIAAIADGRISKRIPYIFGGTPDGGVLHIKSCTVVRDCLEEVCNKINIVDPVEMEEYTLFLHSREESFSSLNRDDYLLDVTAEYARRGTDFDLLFQRTVWYFPVKQTDNEVYIDFMFGQCLPDYLEGLNVILPREGALRQEDYDDICLMAALLYRGYDRQGTPTMQDLKDIVPKFALENVSSIRPQQWLNRIHDYLRNAAHRSSIESKMKFIDVLSGWLLFGATFFKIDSIPGLTGNCLLAINRDGIRFLKTPTHEPIIHHSFSQILSTRRYRSDSGVNYLDMKLGDLMVQKITRIQTDQGSDISSLIGQYMQVSNKNRKRPDRNLTRL